MITLKNEELEVVLHPKGAEIHKIIGMHDYLNYMWRRDPILWANSAPILFPFVGAVNNNEYRIDGKTYTLTQHGFARHTEFETKQTSDAEVIFTLTSNEAIKQHYPYEFMLTVTYRLEGNRLICHMEVKNTDNQDITFGIGGHPAFACPFMDGESSNDYYIEFSENETLERKMIDVAAKGMSYETRPLFDNERRFFVRQAMLDTDAIVVKGFKSENVALKSLNHNKSIVFHMSNFDHLGIWASKHVGGLLAIEPWVGHNDYVGFTGEFKEKEGVRTISPGEVFTCEFQIEINQ